MLMLVVLVQGRAINLLTLAKGKAGGSGPGAGTLGLFLRVDLSGLGIGRDS